MIFLLNQQRILTESLQLAKMKLSEKLNVDLSDVEVGVSQKPDGQIVPEFRISDQYNGKSETEIGDLVKSVWDDVKEKMSSRMKGLSSTRYD